MNNNIRKIIYGCDLEKDENCKCVRVHQRGHKNGFPYISDYVNCTKKIKRKYNLKRY